MNKYHKRLCEIDNEISMGVAKLRSLNKRSAAMALLIEAIYACAILLAEVLSGEEKRDE